MSNKTKDILDEILDIEETTGELVEEKPKDIIVRDDTLDDIDSDYKYQRENFYGLVERGQDAIDGILSVAQDSDSPRAYEVAGQMIKAVADMNKDLMDLHNKMKVITKEETTINHNTNNSIYVGSTSDLQDLINQSRSAKKALNIVDEVEDDE